MARGAEIALARLRGYVFTQSPAKERGARDLIGKSFRHRTHRPWVRILEGIWIEETVVHAARAFAEIPQPRRAS